jgi:GTPase-activating protein SAC7
LNCQGVFARSRSACRVRELEMIFNSPPRYRKGFGLEGYSVYNPGSCLLRYLKLLPEVRGPY